MLCSGSPRKLIAMSSAIEDWLTPSVALNLIKQGAMMTVLSSLLVALDCSASGDDLKSCLEATKGTSFDTT